MNRRLYTGGYVRESDPHAQLERTPTLRLFWHGLGGGLLLLAFFAIATLAIVAASSVGTPVEPKAQHAHAAEAGVGRDSR